MTTQTQHPSGAGARTASGATDWQALEVQLNRTRVILQDILVHLQEVLKNLRMARPSASAKAGAGRTASATWRRTTTQESRQTTAGQAHFRSQTAQQTTSARSDRSQPPPHQGTAGASDRFRSRARTTTAGPRAETTGSRTTAGAHTTAGSRTTAGHERSQTEGARTFRTGTSGTRNTTTAGSRTTASGPFTTNRERPRGDSTWRSKTAGSAGSERESRTTTRTTTTSQRPGPRPTTEKGFRMDGERQRRARETARKSGMNLRCAYDILCLDYPCSVDQIKCAYRHMARLHHPDLGGDEEAMKDVNVAYELAMRFSAGPRRASTAWAV